MKTASSPTSASAQAARKSRALIVPAEVLALPDITLTAKLILAEVLDLYKVSGKVFASDEHFALRLGIGIRTVGDAIKQLNSYDLLTRSFDPKARQKRLLIPTLPNPITASAQEKSLRNPQEQEAAEPADSAKSDCEFRNESLQNPQGVPAKSADINTRVNTKVNSNQTPVGGSAARAAPQKKLEIGEGSASAEGLTSAPSSSQVAAAPPSSPLAARKPSQQGALALLTSLQFPAGMTQQLRDMFTSWVTFRQKRGRPLTLESFQMQVDELAEYNEEFSLALLHAAIKNGTQGLTYPETKRKYSLWLTNPHANTTQYPRRHAAAQQRLHAPVNVSYGQL